MLIEKVCSDHSTSYYILFTNLKSNDRDLSLAINSRSMLNHCTGLLYLMSAYDRCRETDCNHYRKDHPYDGQCKVPLGNGKYCICKHFHI